MEKIHYTTRVFIDSRTAHTIIRVRWEKTEAAFTLECRADVNKWDSNRQRATTNTTHTFKDETYSAKIINTEISDRLEVIDEVFTEFALKSEVPTRQLLKDVVAQKVNGNKKTHEKVVRYTLEELFEQFLITASDERDWGEKIHYKYQQMWKQIHAADSKLTLESLTKAKMTEIKNTYVKNGYNNRTIVKQMKIFHSFLNWIHDQGYELNPGVLDYKPNLKVIARTVTSLTYGELMKFYHYEFPEDKKNLERVRDMFCFMAFTSLRISDLSGLKPCNVVGDNIVICTVKTTDRITIPLIEPAKQLIAKYSGVETKNGTIFPVISDQKMNDELKLAAKMVGLDREVMQEQYYGTNRKNQVFKFYEQISCHDARRTFVCCSLAMGIPVPVVMSCTGHADYESMSPYIEVSNSTQRLELDKWNQQSRNEDLINLKMQLDNATPQQLEAIRQILGQNN